MYAEKKLSESAQELNSLKSTECLN